MSDDAEEVEDERACANKAEKPFRDFPPPGLVLATLVLAALALADANADADDAELLLSVMGAGRRGA